MKSHAITSLAAICLLMVNILVEGQENNELVQVTTIEGKSITLRCTSATMGTTDPKHVEWVDMVYNSSPEPQRIFTTRHNLLIDTTHPNSVNYRVARDYSLTISNVNMDNDPGRYICRSIWDNREELTDEYYLSVATMPTCSGATDLIEGDGETQLECQMLFSGTQPTLQWYHGDELLQSEDHFDVRTALKQLRLRAAHQHDKSKYTCRVTFGDMKESCSVKMNISYLVRDLKITPDKQTVRVGDDVKCSAKGNPAPEVTIYTEGPGGSGHGSKTLVIGEELAGQQVEVRCSASNRVGEKSEQLTISKSFHVKDKVKLTPKDTQKDKHMNDAREPNDEQAHKHEDTRSVHGSDSKTSSAGHLKFSGCLSTLLALFAWSSVTF